MIDYAEQLDQAFHKPVVDYDYVRSLQAQEQAALKQTVAKNLSDASDAADKLPYSRSKAAVTEPLTEAKKNFAQLKL